MEKNLNISSLLDVYGNFLGEKQRSLTEHYYNDDLSLAEIAENEGITRQGVRDLIKRAENQLNELESKCGYSKKFSRLKAISEKVKNGDDVKSHIEELLDLIDSL